MDSIWQENEGPATNDSYGHVPDTRLVAKPLQHARLLVLTP
jgi:hypothetical protein